MADQIIHADYKPEWVQIPKKGPELIKHEMKYFRSVFPDLNSTIIDSASFPDKIWIRYKSEGTQLGPAWGFAASGNKVTFESAAILYIKDGQVFDQWAAFSFYDMLTDLGCVPPLWELSEHLQWKPGD